MNKHIRFEASAVWIESLKTWVATIVIDGQVFTDYNDKLTDDQEGEALDWLLEFRRRCKVIEPTMNTYEPENFEEETPRVNLGKSSPLPLPLSE